LNLKPFFLSCRIKDLDPFALYEGLKDMPMGSTADDEGRPAGNPGRCTAVHPPIGDISEGLEEGRAAAEPEPARDEVTNVDELEPHDEELAARVRAEAKAERKRQKNRERKKKKKEQERAKAAQQQQQQQQQQEEEEEQQEQEGVPPPNGQ
jgi:Skp family chaperone for outer membrane proteins